MREGEGEGGGGRGRGELFGDFLAQLKQLGRGLGPLIGINTYIYICCSYISLF